MDATQIPRLKPKLHKFLKEFDDCFPRKDTRAHLPVYVSGQLSNLPEKSVEPIAIEAGVAPRTLQEFLSQLQWNDDLMLERLQEIVVRDHAGPHRIGMIDETSFVKKGDKTPGVQRQWCGTVGKKENCIVTVHLGDACDDFHCLLDGELFLPESWSNDRERCKEAGIPDDMVYRPKSEIALELYDRALGNGLDFDWIVFDEWYGAKPDFLRALSPRQQRFVGEVPKSFVGWLKPPRVVTRAFRKHGRGRGRKVPRLASGSLPVRRVEAMRDQPGLRDQPWKRWRIKDGDKGPMIWEIKHTLFSPKDENGLPGEPMPLIIARDILHPEEIKSFVSNAAPETSIQTLLLVAFSRWRVERCFEDQNGEVGRDHYEGRRYIGLKRHLTISAVSSLFLARMRQEFGEKKSGVDGVPGACRDCGVDPVLVAEPETLEEAARAHSGEDQRQARKKRDGAEEPRQTKTPAATHVGHQAHRDSPLQMASDIAL
jgi:SRSO17 transposase